MDKEKRKICLALTITGVLLIIVLQTIILIDDENKEKKLNYIKVNITESTKKCINEKKCEEKNITVKELIEKEYLTGYFLEEIKEYTKSSYIEYPTYKVVLIKSD